MSSNNFFTFLAGAAAGAAVAWLLGTEKGRQTTDEIKNKAAEGREEIENAIKDFKAKAEATVKAAGETVSGTDAEAGQAAESEAV